MMTVPCCAHWQLHLSTCGWFSRDQCVSYFYFPFFIYSAIVFIAILLSAVSFCVCFCVYDVYRERFSAWLSQFFFAQFFSLFFATLMMFTVDEFFFTIFALPHTHTHTHTHSYTYNLFGQMYSSCAKLTLASTFIHTVHGVWLISCIKLILHRLIYVCNFTV